MPNTLGSGAGPSWPAELDDIETYEDGTPLITEGPRRADSAFANDTLKTLQRLEQKLGVNPQGASATVAARLGVIEGGLHAPVTLGTPNGLSLAGQALSLGLASATTIGALSSADWIAFNAKESALTFNAPLSRLGNTISLDVGGFVMDGDTAGGVLSGTYPNPGFAVDMATQAELDAVIGSLHAALTLGTANGLSLAVGQVLSLGLSGPSAAGALSAADWSTFNAKESALIFSSPLSRSVNTISAPTVVTSAAALTLDQLVVGGGLQASKTLAAGTAAYFLQMGATIPAWFDLFGTANMWTANITITKPVPTLILTDTTGGDTTPTKMVRVSASGSLEITANAGSVLLALHDNGRLILSGVDPAVEIGQANVSTGSWRFHNSSNSNFLQINATATAASHVWYLPTAQGSAGSVLQNDGAGLLSWIGLSTSTLPEGTNLYFTDERVDDRVNALLVGGAGIDTTYNDIANTLTFTFDATELNALTWGDGTQASNLWTFSLSGATDPTLLFANNLVTLGSAALVVTHGDLTLGVASTASGRLLLYQNTDAFPGILTRAGALTNSRTWTFPDASGTVALLEAPNVFTANQTISNTAPSLVLQDTTASAKSLTIIVDANLAQLRESAGASGSLLVLDLMNNTVAIGALPSNVIRLTLADSTTASLFEIRNSIPVAGSRPGGILFTTPNNANVQGYIGLVQETTEGNHYLYIGTVEDAVAWRNVVVGKHGGNFGVGMFPNVQFELSGSVGQKATGTTWSNPSDIRLKEDITPFTDGLAVIRQVNPVHYTLNGLAGTPKGMKGISVIAQEIMGVAPYTIDTYQAKLNPDDEADTELYRFEASALTFAVINAVKELDSRMSARGF